MLQGVSTRPNILVASVYAPSNFNNLWFKLQSEFIKKNSQTIDFDIGIFLNGVAPQELGSNFLILGQSSINMGHSAGMEQLVAACRGLNYDYYLLLDSDCFPVRENWFEILIAQMQQFGKSFAAPIRYENLDRFPHPCVFFCSRESIHDPRINFNIGYESENLLGEVVKDVGNAMLPMLPDILPMLRTNCVNRHPVAAAVYQHLFYHHGAGSRNFEFRVVNKYSYCNHWWNKENDNQLAHDLMLELSENPEEFISSLMNVPHKC